MHGHPVETFSTGELAQHGRVNLETIRYYEREGLIPPPPRKTSGHRVYGPNAVRRLRFIKRAQELGFSLAEIKELLAIRGNPDELCSDVVRQIDTKTQEVDKRIAHLKAIRRALMRLKNSCDGRCLTSECPILETLDTELA